MASTNEQKQRFEIAFQGIMDRVPANTITQSVWRGEFIWNDGPESSDRSSYCENIGFTALFEEDLQREYSELTIKLKNGNLMQ